MERLFRAVCSSAPRRVGMTINPIECSLVCTGGLKRAASPDFSRVNICIELALAFVPGVLLSSRPCKLNPIGFGKVAPVTVLLVLAGDEVSSRGGTSRAVGWQEGRHGKRSIDNQLMHVVKTQDWSADGFSHHESRKCCVSGLVCS